MARLVLMFIVLALACPAHAQDDGPDAAAAPDVAAPPDAPATPDVEPASATSPLSQIPEDRRPTIKSWVEGDEKVALGHTVTYRVQIRRKRGDKIHLPADTGFGGLELTSKDLRTAPTDDGWVLDDYTMELLALTPGEDTIPALTFGGVLESGEVVKLSTAPTPVTVTDPTRGAESDEPRDIAPVVDVYQDDYTLLWVLGALAVIALVALLVRYLVKNWDRFHPRGPLAPPPPRPPEQVALEKLDDLRDGGLPGSGAKKVWYIDLSEIMREYVGNRYGFDGLESTTEEIVRVMRGKKTAGLTQAELFSFLNDCDMVKFAKYETDEREDQENLEEAYRIVRVTTPNLIAPGPESSEDRGGES